MYLPFWWSPRIYFIHMDEIMGGWRVLYLRIHFERFPIYGHGLGFQMHFRCGIGAKEKLRRAM